MTRWESIVHVSAYFVGFIALLKLVEAGGNRWGRENEIAKKSVDSAMSNFTLSQHETRVNERSAQLAAAHAYLTIALDVCNSVELERISGVDVHELGRAIASKQAQLALAAMPKVRDVLRQPPRV